MLSTNMDFDSASNSIDFDSTSNSMDFDSTCNSKISNKSGNDSDWKSLENANNLINFVVLPFAPIVLAVLMIVFSANNTVKKNANILNR